MTGYNCGAKLPYHSCIYFHRRPRTLLLHHPRTLLLHHPRMHLLRHPRVLLSGDLHKRLFRLSQAFGRPRLGGRGDYVGFFLLNPHAGLGALVGLQNVEVFSTRAGG